MRAFTKSLGFLAILATASVLHADDAVPPAGTVTAGTPSPATPMSTQSELTPAEMQAKSSDMMAQANDAIQLVTSLREKARRQQDAIKLNCINNKLVQLKAQLNIADDENTDLQAAISSNSGDRFTAFSSLRTTVDSIVRLREEAKTCVGQAELIKQESGNVLVTHPQFPDQPQPIDPFSGEVEPPAYASPYI